MSRCLCALLCLLAIGASASDLHAQAEAVLLARVLGDGTALPGASVELLRGDELVRATAAAADGAVRWTGVPVGTYTVRVRAVGYQSQTLRNVALVAGESRILEIRLEPAPIELDALSVLANRLQIATDNTEFATTVDEVAIELLPLAHDPKQLVALTPGARAGHVWGGSNVQANNYQIDGLAANHPGLGGDLIEPSVNWIDRIEVRGLGAGAEYGGFQGGLVDIITKSGGNTFSSSARATLEHDALNASNLARTEIGREVAQRWDVEAEVRGPLIRDRLFYYVAGQRIERNARALNHLPRTDEQYAPITEQREELKFFGKLTWKPLAMTELEASGGYLGVDAENYGLTGYEALGAGHHYSSPTWFANASWLQSVSDWIVLEGKINRFERDERFTPYAGSDVPGIELFAAAPPTASYANAPLRLRSAPASTSGSLVGTFRIQTGKLEHQLKLGATYTGGSFLNERERNGGMTWVPVPSGRFDPAVPTTWSHVSTFFLPSRWGGEVHLDARVANTSAFAQSAIALGSRVVLTPGLRWGRWQGWLDPRDGNEFLAVEDNGFDPRMGAVVKLMDDGTMVLKGHWGRYHQNMIAQMFDRVQGGDVFSNEEVWYYWGEPFADPTRAFTIDERDALAATGDFTRETVEILNEVGPVDGYKQPYVDQWLVAFEKSFGGFVKIEALYTERRNHDMIALVDRNAATNYTLYSEVRVQDISGTELPFEGGPVELKQLYVPNNRIIERLRCRAAALCPNSLDVPGLTYGDTMSLTWNPDYVLTTAPGARREFRQFQFAVEVARPDWGGSFSVTVTDLVGNLDNVSGYTDPTQFNAGPYVRVNESVNAFGTLENFADREAKVSVWGKLPFDFQGGLTWTHASGDHFAPQFRISGLGLYRYELYRSGEEVDWRLVAPMDGHRVFVGPRGLQHHRRRALFDVHLERVIESGIADLALSLDLFNAFGTETVTGVQTLVNDGQNFYPDVPTATDLNQFYRSVLERVPPRTLRMGVAAYF